MSLFYLNPPVLSKGGKIMRVQLLGSFNKECAYEKAMQNPEEYIRLFTRDESDIYDPDVNEVEVEDSELTRQGNFLHVDDEKRQKYLFVKETSGFKLYKLLPNVKESDIYHWKELPSCRSCTRRLWAQVNTSLMRFNITYYLVDDSANISITIGGDTIRHMNIEHATNDKITKLINDYIEDFKQKANSLLLITENTNDDYH